MINGLAPSKPSGWKLDVDRGPDWIFVRVHEPHEGSACGSLAEAVWKILDQNFTYRVVIELDKLRLLHSQLIGQLVLLSKKASGRGGLLRICGLSEDNLNVLRCCRLSGCMPSFENRGDAVMGHRPSQPR